MFLPDHYPSLASDGNVDGSLRGVHGYETRCVPPVGDKVILDATLTVEGSKPVSESRMLTPMPIWLGMARMVDLAENSQNCESTRDWLRRSTQAEL